MGERFIGLLLAMVVECGMATAGEQPGDRFENAAVGISLMRPAGWRMASLQEVAAQRASRRLTDKEMEARLQRVPAPLFVFTKYPPSHPSLSPTITVKFIPLRSLADVPPEEMLRTTLTMMKRGAPDLTLLEEVHSTEVSGLKAAAAKAAYTSRHADGSDYKILTRMWMIPRGQFVFIVGMNGPQDGPDVSEQEFRAVLASVKIER